jgi:hypothetical protein
MHSVHLSVVVTIDPMDTAMPVVASAYCEVQHTILLCLLHKNHDSHAIPTSSCVLAFIAINKGTLQTPVLHSASL